MLGRIIVAVLAIIAWIVNRTDSIEERCRFVVESGGTCPNSAATSSEFCRQHSVFVWDSVYLETAHHLRQDLREFWSRNGFFLLIQGALFSVFASLDTTSTVDPVKRAAESLPLLGGLIALIWIWIAWWSVVWISRWHKAFLRVEAIVDPLRGHAAADKGSKSGIQTAAVFIPYLFAVGWVYVSWDQKLPANLLGGSWSTGQLVLVLLIAETFVLALLNFRSRRLYKKELERRGIPPR